MYGHDAMEVQEAFTKIREQAKTFLLQPELLGCGLNLVNTQNLNYFQPHYQAEIFRLKGVFLQVKHFSLSISADSGNDSPADYMSFLS